MKIVQGLDVMSPVRLLSRAKLFAPGVYVLSRLLTPTIRSKGEIAPWVALVTLSSIFASAGIEFLIECLSWIDASTTIRNLAIACIIPGCVSGPIAFFVGHTHLALFKAQQAAERASLTDPLTGLMNRRALNVRIAKLDGATLALVIADIDHFKRVNDAYGHLAGDHVIAAVGQILAETLADF